MSAHTLWTVEHGARRDVVFVQCSCGWSSPATRSPERHARAHTAQAEAEMIERMRAAGNCTRHDLPAGPDGRCAECDWQRAAEAERQRDGARAWDER